MHTLENVSFSTITFVKQHKTRCLWRHCIYSNAMFISQWTEATEYWVPRTTMHPIRCLTMKAEEYANKKVPFICCKWWRFDTEANNLWKELKKLHKNAMKMTQFIQSFFSCLDTAGYQKPRVESWDAESKHEEELIRVLITNNWSSTKQKHYGKSLCLFAIFANLFHYTFCPR